MRRLAIVTNKETDDLYGDAPHLLPALEHVGIEGVTMPWGKLLDPDEFVGALVRTTWDYVDAREEFVRWAHEVEALMPLANPAAVLEWNSDKRYLAELARRDVPVVPTRWVGPGDEMPELDWDRLVVKPAVSAGGRTSASYSRDDIDAIREHVEFISSAGGTALVQPHIDSVDTEGELGIYVIGGEVTHAVAKGQILPTGEGRVDDFSRAQNQHARRGESPSDLDTFAKRVVGAIPKHLGDVLYARVDVVRDDTGGPLVIELELIEPFLFFEHTPEAAAPFAAAVDEWLHRAHARGR